MLTPVPASLEGKPYVRGLDISTYQRKMNLAPFWSAGFRWIFLRTGDGKIVDKDYAKLKADARKIGFFVGNYHFMRVGSGAEVDAQLAMLASQQDHVDLPPMLDWEVASGGESKERVRRSIRQSIDFCNLHFGRCIVYTMVGFFDSWWGRQRIDDADLMVANHGVERPMLPAAFDKARFWQHTGHGTGPAPDHHYPVDLGVFYGNYADLRAYVDGVCTTT